MSLLYVLSLVLLFGLSSLGETINVSDMSREELMELQEQINIALGNDIVQGQYTVGVDIKAGIYVISALATYSSQYLDVRIYDSEEDANNRHSSLYHYLAEGEELRIDLVDGMILKLEDGLAILRPYQKKNYTP